ncbi:MAG TPA: hypothetical protein VH418_12795 [Solirubrobacteraceae bacterium]
MRNAWAPEPDRSAVRAADRRPRTAAGGGSLLALQRTAGNRAACAVLAREPRITKRWGDEAGDATYLDVSPGVMSGRLHLPDIQLHTWADKENKVRGLPLDGAVLNSLKLIDPTLRLSGINQRLSGRATLSWDTGNPYSSPTEADVQLAVWRKKGTLRFDVTAEAMGLEGEAKIKVTLPKHDSLEDLWKDIEAAVLKAVPTLELGPIKADTLRLLEALVDGKIDQKAFVKGLAAIVSRLRKNVPKALEQALWGALSEVFPKIEARIKVHNPVPVLPDTRGSAHAGIKPSGPYADLTVYGTVLAPPGKVSSTLAPVLGVYGERWELGRKLSFQGGLLQKLNPDAFAKPGSSFADKFPTALYGEVTYTRELESGYELSVTFSLKLSTDELGQGPQQPSRNDMFSDRVRDSLKAGGGRTEFGQTPQPGDIPTMIGVTVSGTHDLGK